jgi:hypothetical protein
MSRVNKIAYIQRETYVEGILPCGTSFYIDTEDYAFVSSNMWHLCDGYLRSTKHGLLHRYLKREQLGEGLQVDHINLNRLDNRKGNLNVVTQQENLHKKKVYKSNKSGVQGVKWNKNLNKWQAQITRNKQRVHLGVFDNLQDAIVARKTAE